ncbi:MAG: hypothetical protein HUK03_00310 [Bacteroidaceae bacterium]|nr:hypothetical protein [Bacteroidaceae bacterium]
MKRIMYMVIGLALSQLPVSAVVRVVTAPTIPMAKEVKGHFAGQVDGELVTWGGYYRTRNVITRAWCDHYDPFAYGASVAMPQGALFVGGKFQDLAATQVAYRKPALPGDAATNWGVDLSCLEMRPALPTALYRLAATRTGDYVYAFAGRGDSLPNQRAWRIAWPNGKEWEPLADMPGEPRLSPSVVVCDGLFGTQLLVVGGCREGGDTLDYRTLHKSGVRYDVAKDRWEEVSWADVADSLLPAAGGVLMPMDRYRVAFVGGRERDGAYRSHVVIYNWLWNSWSAHEGDPLFARCDAAVSPYRDGWLLSGGEVAPGTNTSAVTFVLVEEKDAWWWLVGAPLVLLPFGVWLWRGKRHV